jgi:NAD(P)-dependent dehydrogenase (short-subunit alcohol dehydrogenase family)
VTRPGAAMPHYYASKAALANLTISLAKDLAGTGITANTVSPGLIKTPEVEQWFRHLAQKKGWGDDWDEIERAGVREVMSNPLARMARPEEVADLVVFVACERGAYVNGAHLRIDGGASESLG